MTDSKCLLWSEVAGEMLLILAALSALLSLGNGEIFMHFIPEGFGFSRGALRACLLAAASMVGREGGWMAMAQLVIFALNSENSNH